MWRRIVPVLFVFSVALNAAFLGVWGARALHGEPDEGATAGRSQESRLCCEAGVGTAELRELTPLLEEFTRERCEICRRLDRTRAELIEALAAEAPDRDLIRAKQEEIVEAQRQMQDLIVKQLLRQKDVLTPEQQQRLFDYFRKTCRCSAVPGETSGCCPKQGEG
jgi:hypothetical protein